MTKKITEEQLALLNDSFPVSNDESRIIYPRFGMLGKDVVEVSGAGKNKKVTVLQAAGSFYTEKDEGEINEETGKKKWTKTFIDGETVDIIISFQRKQLRMYDQSLKKYYNSQIFDDSNQFLSLFLDRQVVKKGTQKELQAMFPTLTQKGKPSSKLEEEIILYVIYEGETYQMNVPKSAKWDFKDYAKLGNPSACITTLGSIEETKGDNTYSKVTFKKGRTIDRDEFEKVRENQTTLEEVVENDSQLFIEGPSDSFDKITPQ